MSTESAEVQREGLSWSRFKRLLLLKIDRWVLTVLILFTVFITLLALSRVGLAPLRTVVENKNGIRYLFTELTGAIVTGTAIVVTINQLVLSQELGALGDQRERMQNSMDFRRDIEAATGSGAGSTDPAEFLSGLTETVEARAYALEDTVSEGYDTECTDAVTEYVDSLTAATTVLSENLEDARFGTFELLWSALQFNYSQHLHTGRQVRADFDGSLSDDASEQLDEIIELLEFFGPLREHFKTLYFEWELINLSRVLLYIAVPTLTVLAALILYVDASTFPGSTLGIENLVWVTSAGFVVAISPFVFFIVYILRIATIAKQTLAIGPFILQDQ